MDQKQIKHSLVGRCLLPLSISSGSSGSILLLWWGEHAIELFGELDGERVGRVVEMT